MFLCYWCVLSVLVFVRKAKKKAVNTAGMFTPSPAENWRCSAVCAIWINTRYLFHVGILAGSEQDVDGCLQSSARQWSFQNFGRQWWAELYGHFPTARHFFFCSKFLICFCFSGLISYTEYLFLLTILTSKFQSQCLHGLPWEMCDRVCDVVLIVSASVFFFFLLGCIQCIKKSFAW